MQLSRWLVPKSSRMNDFTNGSHPPSSRHISHQLSLKLRKLVCPRNMPTIEAPTPRDRVSGCNRRCLGQVCFFDAVVQCKLCGEASIGSLVSGSRPHWHSVVRLEQHECPDLLMFCLNRHRHVRALLSELVMSSSSRCSTPVAISEKRLTYKARSVRPLHSFLNQQAASRSFSWAVGLVSSGFSIETSAVLPLCYVPMRRHQRQHIDHVEMICALSVFNWLP